MSLAGKTLFITGASRGIGLAIALRAARTAPMSPSPPRPTEPHPKPAGHDLLRAAEEIETAGGKALPLAVDIRFEDQVMTAVDEDGAARFGGIDICVNNASAISAHRHRWRPT